MIGAFSDPRQVVAALGVKDGETVADFGAGSGAYAVALGRLVGSSGRVYAVDVQKNLLGNVATRAKEAGLGNVEVIWGDIERLGGTRLRDASADWVVLANVLFQVGSLYTTLLEAKRVLRPSGKVALVDWLDSYGHLGPTPAQVVTPAKAEAALKEAGFKVGRSFPAGEHHWGLIAEREWEGSKKI